MRGEQPPPPTHMATHVQNKVFMCLCGKLWKTLAPALLTRLGLQLTLPWALMAVGGTRLAESGRTVRGPDTPSPFVPDSSQLSSKMSQSQLAENPTPS